MKLKLDADGHAVLQDGKPLYVHDDGKEVPFDAPGTVAKISELNGEAKRHREAKEAAEEALKVFEGLDPEASKKALETVKNLNDKKLIDAGEVGKIRDEAVKAVEDKYAPVVKERDALAGKLVEKIVSNAFAHSKYIADKLVLPPDLAEAAFAKNFKIEGDNLVGYGREGKQIFSREKPGELAAFDEAMEILVAEYPRRDSILKGTGASGGGSKGGSEGGGSNTLTRSKFDSLDAGAKHAHVKGGGKIVDG